MKPNALHPRKGGAAPSHFVVELDVISGVYEKATTRLIKADTAEEAERIALSEECHGVLGESAEWTENGVMDLYGEFYYAVRRTVLVPPEHAKVLREYLR
ncbi:hypothetical protein LWH94_18280 [Marinobacter sp. G11]|uniref:hypothetical protein n=1 Tax=Marinobacter sp. G11 TaxID=2903522 RepID=UPI001E4DE3A4|nr:hypothetical protein [Marinobacter sp. G11]MCE0761127.1 hypothetical protein [Marinobacter sp. G11]